MRKNGAPYLYTEYAHASAMCMGFATRCPPGKIAYAIGPGGCGKTEIAKYVRDHAFGSPDTWQIGKQPVVMVTADNSDRGFFSSKGLALSMLKAVYDPFRSAPSDVARWNLPDHLKKRLTQSLLRRGVDEATEQRVREAFIEVAIERKVKLIIIDEGNLLVLTQKGREPTDYVESLRGLSENVGCAVLLIGTVAMIRLMGHSGQLNRRNFDVHVERMRCETKEGKLEFLSFLKHVEEEYDELEDGVLGNHASELHAGTYGIPGELHGAIERADMLREVHGEKRIHWNLLKGALHNPMKQALMKEEADIVHKVINGLPLSESEGRSLENQGRKNRSNPRRRELGR